MLFFPCCFPELLLSQAGLAPGADCCDTQVPIELLCRVIKDLILGKEYSGLSFGHSRKFIALFWGHCDSRQRTPVTLRELLWWRLWPVRPQGTQRLQLEASALQTSVSRGSRKYLLRYSRFGSGQGRCAWRLTKYVKYLKKFADLATFADPRMSQTLKRKGTTQTDTDGLNKRKTGVEVPERLVPILSSVKAANRKDRNWSSNIIKDVIQDPAHRLTLLRHGIYWID